MTHRRLGSTGAAVTSHALGTMTFGAESDEATSHAILDLYLASGGNLVDTADVYSHGGSEKIVGSWLRARPGARDAIVLATKGRFPLGEGPNALGASRMHLTRALDHSLRRLGVDHIDLYQVHAWDALTPMEETLRFADDAVRAGKIRYFGVSNYLGWQLTKATQLARAHRWIEPATVQSQYNLLAREVEFEVVPAALDAGSGLLAWSPLAGGWLTGKYTRGSMPTGSTRLGENPQRGMEAWNVRGAAERTWRVLDEVAAVADELGTTPARIALAWVAAQPGVSSVILGARTTEQLADNLRAFELELGDEVLARLGAASAPEVGDYPYGTAGVARRHRRIEGGR